KIRILVDFSFVAFRGRPEFARFLRAKGVQVRYYNTSALYRLFAIQHRSHRKLLIIDNKIAVTGGRNIADDYFDLRAKFNFIDSDVLLKGPLTESITKSFDLYWNSPLTSIPHEMSGPMPQLLKKHKNRFKAKE